MSRNISLFSNYYMGENRVTNYSLLILKLIYEENPKHLDELLSALFHGNLDGAIGVRFEQQVKSSNLVADGAVMQRGMTILIEVKNSDWFYEEQLERYIVDLESNQNENRALLLLSNFEGDPERRFQELFNKAHAQHPNITLSAQSFEALLSTLKSLEVGKNLEYMINEFEEFLNEEGLLPSWDNWLDVVNCAGLPEDVLIHSAYICPAAGGAYSHGRCKYFGMYRNKQGQKVSLIRGVVDIESDETAHLKWKHVETSDDDLIEEAEAIAISRRPDELPVRVFLLDTLYDTEFEKDSKGGDAWE